MAGLVIAGQTGVQALADGASTPPRLIRSGELGVSEIHGRFYEQCYRGNLFLAGNAGVALSANSITTSATTTPILGLWNPPTSGINVVLLQCALQVYINTVTSPVGCGPILWGASSGNGSLTAGVAPYSRKTLNNVGSQVRIFNGSQALTGLTNTLATPEIIGDFTNPGSLTSGTVANTALVPSFGGVWNIDGSLIIQPGTVWALLNTTSTVTMTAAGRLLWEEVPV